MKYLPWLLLALVIYLLIRLQNERLKTDAQVKTLAAKIPDAAMLQETVTETVQQAVNQTAVNSGFDYVSSYQAAKL